MPLLFDTFISPFSCSSLLFHSAIFLIICSYLFFFFIQRLKSYIIIEKYQRKISPLLLQHLSLIMKRAERCKTCLDFTTYLLPFSILFFMIVHEIMNRISNYFLKTNWETTQQTETMRRISTHFSLVPIVPNAPITTTKGNGKEKGKQ